MFACAVPGGRLLAAFAIIFVALPALAQAQKSGEEAYAFAAPPSIPPEQHAPPPAEAPPADDSGLLSRALSFDPAALSTVPLKPLKIPGLGNPSTLGVTRTDTQPDGSGTVVVKRPLPTYWNATVGADLGLASNTSPMASGSIDRPLPTRGERSSGAAWASLGIADLATVNARVDPTNDQGRIGTTLQRSIPFGSRFSLGLSNTYSISENFGYQDATAPTDIPVMTVPQAAANPSQVWDNQSGVTFGILSTGTTLGASVAASSIDPVTHNTFSAEQKLIGPFHVTTAVTDVGQATESKSIAAGFKVNW